jgi:hypothetical protein
MEKIKKMPWAHPLKGRTIREALFDALSEKLPKGNYLKNESDLETNDAATRSAGGISWEALVYIEGSCLMYQIHSWDTMKECLRYGFDFHEDGREISARK